MSEETKVDASIVDESKAGGDQQPSVAELQAQLAEAQAEAARYRNQRKKVEQERDELKAKTKPNPQEENYKQLWEEAQEKATKAVTKAKNADIRAALVAKLPTLGVKPNALETALKLVNSDLIEWDEDNGVNGTSVTAALQTLKKEHSILFEGVVPRRDAKVAVDGSASEKTITRAEFDQLMATNPAAWSAKRKEGYKVVG